MNHSRHTPPCPRCLRQLTLRPILRIPRINRQVVLLLRHRLPDTLPPLHRLDPHAPPLPDALILASLPLLRNPQPTVLKMVKDPQPDRPRRECNIRYRELRAHPVRPPRIRLLDPRLQMPKHFLPGFVQTVRAGGRVLQEAVEGRDDARRDVVDPDLHARPLVPVGRVEARGLRGLPVQELADDVRFVEGLGGAVGLGAGEGRDQAARVEGQEGGFFVVRIDFDVLVRDLLLFEGEPGALDESRIARRHVSLGM